MRKVQAENIEYRCITMTRREDLLSTHRTLATFQGIQHRPCMFRTALCPDRCGHGQDVATFKIDSYTDYQKPGEYGDPQMEQFMTGLKLSGGDEMEGQSQQMIDKVKSLNPGQKVKLDWDHIYVHDDHGAHPERPIKSIELA